MAVVPQQDIELAAKEIRRAATLPGIKAALIRPNPSADWKPFNHDVYDPLWEAASSTGWRSAEVFTWDVPRLKMKPSEYFRRQCWISFDTDELTLAHAANSPIVGADRIVWASDYPHPDAKIPGVVAELRDSIAPLTDEQRRLIAGGSAVALYDL